MANGKRAEGLYGARGFGVMVFVMALSLAVVVYFGGRQSSAHPQVGQPAPEIPFTYPDGTASSVGTAKGSAQLLNFWASWCSPCMAEMPSLRELEDLLSSRGLIILAFNMGESRERIGRSLSGTKVPRNLIFQYSEESLEGYGINAIPLSVLIDGDGIVRRIYSGPVRWMDGAVIREIEQALPTRR